MTDKLKKTLNHDGFAYKIPKNAVIGQNKMSVTYKNRGTVSFYTNKDGLLDCSTEGFGYSQVDFIKDAYKRLYMMEGTK